MTHYYLTLRASFSIRILALLVVAAGRAGAADEAAQKKEESLKALVEGSAHTRKANPFVLAKAPSVDTLVAGGFAKEPSYSDDFGPDWKPQTLGWRVATWKQNGTLMAPERCAVDGEGHLVQTLAAGEPPRGGSIQSTKEFGWGRWIARVKPSAVPGALNSFFTKDWDDLTTSDSEHDGKKAEVDIELITRTFGPDRGEVHLAIHLDKRPRLFEVDIPLDFNPSDAFHDWGYDILPDRVVWHVDGKFLHEWKYTKEDFVDEGYEVFFNSWANKKWIGGPPVEDAKYLIDSVKFYPHEADGR